MGGSTTRQLAGKRKQKAQMNKRAQLQPGDMLQERYRIMGTLGVGGFSSVYQARDMRFASVTRLCAIKEMINTAGDPEIRELAKRSFESEASLLATMHHSAVPDVYDYFSEGDRSYLVMEYIRGKDLEGTLEERNEPVEEETVIEWALQVCDVLKHLHNNKPQPIVFRDLKPSNIMLDQNGRIRLIDFGIAKVFQSDAKGTMIGTEGYSPPEQYRGEASPAGDVYALGATMHHLLTLKDPRMEPPFSWQERHIRDINPNVSAELEAVINRCLAYSTAERFADGTALSEALELVRRAKQGSQLAQTALAQTAPATPPPTLPQSTPISTPVPTIPQATPIPQAAKPLASDIQPIWTFRCEDEIRSKPAVADKLVYVGAYDNNLYAINIADGSFRWKYPATDGIASAPYVYKDDVYIGSADQHLYSINRHNGRLQWRCATQGAVYSSPCAEFDHVFFGSDDGHLYAVNVANGRVLWKAKAHGEVRSSPLITDDAIYFGTDGGYIFGVDLSGKLKWQFQAKRPVISSPALSQDMIVVGSMDSTVYALDANSGWAVWRARTARPIISSPVIKDDTVYIGSSDGKLYALDVFSGRQLWTFETDGQVASSPAIWEDAVYFGSTDGYVYCVDTRKGRLRWRYRTNGYVISSPNIVNGIIYIGSSDHHLYALPT